MVQKIQEYMLEGKKWVGCWKRDSIIYFLSQCFKHQPSLPILHWNLVIPGTVLMNSSRLLGLFLKVEHKNVSYFQDKNCLRNARWNTVLKGDSQKQVVTLKYLFLPGPIPRPFPEST